MALPPRHGGERPGERVGTRRTPGSGVGAYDRQQGEVYLLRPPHLQYASGVVALDGMPTKEMWELTLGERLNHRQVLSDEARVEEIEELYEE